MTVLEFRVAAYLFGGYALLLFATFLMALRRGYARQRFARMSATLGPQVRESLIDCLAGNNDLTKLKGFLRLSRGDVADAVLSFQGTVGGSALDRLCELTLNLALAHEWCEEARSKDVMVRCRAFVRLAFICSFEPCRRVAGELLVQGLDDPDAEVRLAASRGLVNSGELGDIERVFEMAVARSLLVRVLLTEDLRRHANGLCEGIVARIFESEDSKRILGTLEILMAWQRALPLRGLGPAAAQFQSQDPPQGGGANPDGGLHTGDPERRARRPFGRGTGDPHHGGRLRRAAQDE